MNRRGMTLLELLVGLVTAAIIASVCAKVLLLGIKTYNYSARQTASLTRTRKALAGDGSRAGLLGAARGAYVFSTVSASSVAVTSSSAATNFYVKNSNLYRTKSGSSVIQADGVGALTLTYYMSTAGIVSSTTVASSATMVTALVSVTTGAVSAGTYNAYSLYSGAKLRDHP
jgi:prepilin-type N-terminal cleavage/methylation domain-containing protein